MLEHIPEFLEYCLQSTPPENKQLQLGIVTAEVADQILQQSGINVAGYTLTIDVYAVRHIMKSHGNVEREEARGQKAVSNSDFELLAQVIQYPDAVFYDGKNKIGREVIQFQKKIGDLFIILKEVRTGRKQLALNSMRIIKTKRNQG